MSLKHSPHIVIGFAGRAGSGKTTLAKRVMGDLKMANGRPPVARLSLAGPLKDGLKCWGVTKGDWPGDAPHPLFRTAAQKVGALMRSLDQDFWVNLARETVRGTEGPTIFVMDDVRFPNEAGLCDLLYRLHTDRDNGLAPAEMLHESEVHWPTFTVDGEFVMDETDEITSAAFVVVNEVLERWKAR